MSEAKHRKLKERAASKGMTITDYVKNLVDQDLKKPSWAEIASRIDAMEPMTLSHSSAEIIRSIRDEM